ncbi:MAG: zf-HC2 domain-containing protein [Planctomycetaceae bacterium]|nr:zf-HC2 domain-containing protein [Planctomycetaceae bacterium]
MICSDARHLIHLDAGNDLNADQEHSLAEHMERCAECRSYHAGMMKAMGVLHLLRDHSADEEVFESVWSRVKPGIQQQAASRRQRTAPAARHFNTRIAALCVCSLALAVITIVQKLPVSQEQDRPDSMPAWSVSNGGWQHMAPPQQFIPLSVQSSDAMPGGEQPQGNWTRMNLQYPLKGLVPASESPSPARDQF